MAFERVRRHLSGGSGRRRVSGLTATARALYLPYFVRAAQAPGADPGLGQQGCRGAACRRARGVRADWCAGCRRRCCGFRRTMCCRLKIFRRTRRFRRRAPLRCGRSARARQRAAAGDAPVERRACGCFARDYYAALALQLRGARSTAGDAGGASALGRLHQVDVVEMPGQVTIRGGILDVYSPERSGRCASTSSATRSSRSGGSIPIRSARARSLDRRAAAAADRDAGDGEAAGARSMRG